MGFVASHQLADMVSQLVVRVRGNMVKLINRNQAIVSAFLRQIYPPQSRRWHGCKLRLDHRASRKVFTASTLPPSLPSGLQRFHRGSTCQSAQKPNLVRGSSWKLAPIAFSPGNDDRLFQVLVFQLIEGDKHQRPTFPRGGGRFNQQILFPPFLVGDLLIMAHQGGVGAGRSAIGGRRLRKRKEWRSLASW
ncbi:hypothetical protein N39L_57860 [Limnospira platensis NIES-39]|uniref:Transposase n=1 Tax=Limnospira platensis NIES-46 TaxID=1236695 RepID=A0A5M3TBL3_LIMPL|nr:hypothetical protein N39L_57860 [Arthrospira platensis NIES-39]GCE95226.1 hypothetical protein NIES46_32880 [Arthrospira platensis NIES-46]